MDRIDALLGHDTERYALLGGDTLAETTDEELQAIVRAVAQELRMPIALVSLVLEKTQFFRAHHGLPDDLALTRATDRDSSFCQFVVRDGGEFAVTDARNDDRIPKALVDRYGIQAYIGVPLVLDEVVVGSLCAIGLQPREFSPDERRQLGALAARASARLAQLGTAHRPRATVLERTGRAVIAELRNLLLPLLLDSSAARVAIADLAPLARIARETAGPDPGLVRASEALADLKESIDAIHDVADLLRVNVEALAKIMGTRSPPSLAEVVEASSRLAHHHTKLVGGVRWPDKIPQCRIRLDRPYAICAVTTVLSSLASESRDGGSRPLEARLDVSATTLVISIETRTAEAAARCVGDLSLLFGEQQLIKVRTRGEKVELLLELVDEDKAARDGVLA